MQLPKNIGAQDRMARLIGGGVLVVLGLVARPIIGGHLALILVLLGALALFTSYTRTCLAYIPLKMDTNKDGD